MMFDPEFDPYEKIMSHDQWLLTIAEHMEQLAGAGAELARRVERQEGQVRHMTITISNQRELILQLNERLLKVETK